MRVLITTHGGSGHWRPLAPLARALAMAGHDVAFATTPAFCAIIARYGFSCLPIDADDRDAGHSRTVASTDPAHSAATDQASFVWANVFAGSRVLQSLPTLLNIGRSWQPDLIVREISEFAGCIVAELLGLPHAAVQISAFRPALHEVIAEPLRRARRAAGLAPEDAIEMLYRYALLALAPPSFHSPAHRLPATAHFIRYTPFDQLATEPRQGWLETLPPRPVVFATLGTAYNRTPGILPMIQDALSDVATNLIVTTGEREQFDLRRMGDRLWFASYLPQSAVFPVCDGLVCHGGFNTVMTAIACGLPLVNVPIAADQADNAARCADLGIGIVIAPSSRTPGAIRNAVCTILRDRRYQQRIEVLRDETQSLPGPEYAVELLERLGRKRTPLLAERLDRIAATEDQ